VIDRVGLQIYYRGVRGRSQGFVATLEIGYCAPMGPRNGSEVRPWDAILVS